MIEDKPNLAIELYMDEVAPVDPDTVGQFTGLYDREDNEIFEGDIVKNESAGFCGFVKYNDAAFIIYLGEMNGVLLICLQTCAMKVIGNIYDNPKLPKGAKISTVETNDNNGVLEIAVGFEQKYVPKDGDVVSCNGVVAIYAGTNGTGGIKTYAALHEQRLQTVVCEMGWGYTSDYGSATEAEKQRLFDALAKQGKRWNAEKKCIEDLPRWRAQMDEKYYFVDIDCSVTNTKEIYFGTDKIMYEVGNYFRTREAAEKVASQIRDIFKNSKAE